MAASKQNEYPKFNWEDAIIEDSSDLEDSWAGEEVMFDASPSSGKSIRGGQIFLACHVCRFFFFFFF
jgi:hypothetical protein